MPPPGSQPKFLEPLLGIVFDLDGTLVLSHHDFGRMRAEVIRTAEHYGVTPGHLSVQQPIHRIVEAAREELRNSGRRMGFTTGSKRSTRSGSTRSSSRPSRERLPDPARRSY